MEITLEKIVAWAKRKGFTYPGSQIYGGLANAWDFGPYGIELKNNIRDLWWKEFVQKRTDIIGIDAQILMNNKVWKASGHVDGFNDPLMDCKKCKNRFRADKLIEEYLNNSKTIELPNNWAGEGTPHADLIDYIKKNNIKCPICGTLDYTDIRSFNLLFKTHQGVLEDQDNLVYLRPETCQGIFANFKNFLDTTRIKMPFGVAQIGKTFRNEINPGSFIYRLREFEQMEIEYFVDPANAQTEYEKWKKTSNDWWTVNLGISADKIRARQLSKEEAAHYSAGTYDFEYLFPWGWGEIQAFNNRTDYDLSNHQKFSGENLQYSDPKTGKRYIPHVIELSLGLTRTTFVMMCQAYCEEEYTAKNGEKEIRTVAKFPKNIAPIKFAILPLLEKNENMINLAQKIYTDLAEKYHVEIDISGGIGKRYRRQDEIGTPYCLTIDHQSLEDQTVTIRDRDSMTQERIKIEKINLVKI